MRSAPRGELENDFREIYSPRKILLFDSSLRSPPSPTIRNDLRTFVLATMDVRNEDRSMNRPRGKTRCILFNIAVKNFVKFHVRTLGVLMRILVFKYISYNYAIAMNDERISKSFEIMYGKSGKYGSVYISLIYV